MLRIPTHLFKALVLPTFMYGAKIWGGDLKSSDWKVSEKGMKMHMMSHVKVWSTTTYHILLAEFRELPIELYTLKLTMGFQQQLAHLTPSWLVSKATSLSRNQAEQGFNTWHKWTTMWKTSFSLGNPWQTKHIKNNIWWYEGGFSLLRSRTLSISLGRN